MARIFSFFTLSLGKSSFFALFLLLSFSAFGQTYNYYYGNIHSHSEFSDGNQDSSSTNISTPAEDFGYANASFHLDFLGISDHNHNAVGMTLAKYHAGVAQALASTTSDFVALYGMEYGVIANGGHVLLYGIDSLVGWEAGNYDIFNSKFNYATLWGLVNARPAAFASLAHPQLGDYTNLDGSSYSATADQAISGLSIRSGYAFSTTTNYTDNPATLYESYFQTLLSKGYHVAPSVDHDNHNTTFGRTLPGRTVVLAQSLTKADILAGLKSMHYFCSDDWNTQVNYTIGGNMLGSIVNMNTNPNISVNVSDPDNEVPSKIEIFYGTPGSNALPTVLTTVNNSSTLNYTHTLAIGQTRYYYARITQSDGDLIWTAPIWVTRVSTPVPIELSDFTATADRKNVTLNWKALNTLPATFYVQRSEDGLHFKDIGSVIAENGTAPKDYTFTDETAARGLHFYRLRQLEASGEETYSIVVSALLDRSPLEMCSIRPNPTHGLARCVFYADAEMSLHWSLFDASGRLVKTANISTVSGENSIELDMQNEAAGLYFMTVGANGERMLELRLEKE